MLSRCEKIPDTELETLRNTPSGIYLLELYSQKKFSLKNNKFSDIILEEGFYYYVGSAQKNLSSRILRHFKKEKTLHWHIDYITSNNSVEIISALIIPGADKSVEWEIAKDLENYFDLSIPIKQFGNSDTSLTKSHLFYSKEKILYSHFILRYQSMVRFKPSSKEIFGT